jgi:UDP-glucuronate decarboxylase
MKRIVVTGGAGVIGSNLCRRLLGEGAHVICVDNLFSGKLTHIRALFEHENFEFVGKDITKEDLNVGKIDELYNLACPASPVYYQSDPISTIRTNVLGAMNMLELAKVHGAKFLQTSTSEVYGNPSVHPQVESYWGNVNPIGERSCYDEGKRCAEAACYEYFKKYGFPIKIVRIFNTYGPNMRENDGRVISNFIMSALQGRPITIYGPGEQTRSFCYVDDLVDALIRMMETPDDFLGPVNLGNPGEFTMLELAEKVLKITDSSSALVYEPLPPDDPARRRPDITLAKELLGWEPTTDLDTGLKATIAYFKSLL